MTKLEAIKELITYDHCFLSPEGVKRIGEPFEYFELERVKDTRSQHKGLNASAMGAKEGDIVEGMDTMVLAMNLCKKEGIEYELYHGRGSQLRECCKKLIKHLENQQTEEVAKSALSDFNKDW